MTRKAYVTPRMTLAIIYAEAADPASSARLNPERAEWFVSMLRNAIANAEQTLRLIRDYPNITGQSSAEFWRDRVAKCEATIKVLEA